jgi:hypothetical protein
MMRCWRAATSGHILSWTALGTSGLWLQSCSGNEIRARAASHMPCSSAERSKLPDGWVRSDVQLQEYRDPGGMQRCLQSPLGGCMQMGSCHSCSIKGRSQQVCIGQGL